MPNDRPSGTRWKPQRVQMSNQSEKPELYFVKANCKDLGETKFAVMARDNLEARNRTYQLAKEHSVEIINITEAKKWEQIRTETGWDQIVVDEARPLSEQPILPENRETTVLQTQEKIMTIKPLFRYKDTWQEFPNMEEMAQARVRNPSPMLGGATCPAWENTFAVSEDDGASWRNHTPEENDQLAQAIRDTGECCQKFMVNCLPRS